ncbi:MAG: acyltransferase, partial [Actinobacteria bacterium]|nr:acyltransferase [Actinomycetota bacterium]
HRACTDDPWFFRWGFSAMALAVAPLTLCFARTKDAWISRLFSWKVARKVGEMSYSLYVWHLFAFALAGIFVEGSSRLIEVPAKVAVAFGVSWLAHRYIDQVVIRMKMRFATEKVVLDRATGKEVSLEAAQALAHGTVPTGPEASAEAAAADSASNASDRQR